MRVWEPKPPQPVVQPVPMEESDSQMTNQILQEINEGDGFNEVNAINEAFKDIPCEWYKRVHHLNHVSNKFNTKYMCLVQGCNKTFSQVCNLKRHMLMHKGVMLFECPVCTRKFSQKGNMLRHRRICQTKH